MTDELDSTSLQSWPTGTTVGRWNCKLRFRLSTRFWSGLESKESQLIERTLAVTSCSMSTAHLPIQHAEQLHDLLLPARSSRSRQLDGKSVKAAIVADHGDAACEAASKPANLDL